MNISHFIVAFKMIVPYIVNIYLFCFVLFCFFIKDGEIKGDMLGESLHMVTVNGGTGAAGDASPNLEKSPRPMDSISQAG